MPYFRVVASVGAALMGCAQLSTEMGAAEEAYKQARYEDSEVWLSSLESDVGEMRLPMQARFYFLRGMTAYRRGRRNDALHFLALAREVVEEGDVSLKSQWKEQLAAALAELTPTGASWRPRRSPDPGRP